MSDDFLKIETKGPGSKRVLVFGGLGFLGRNIVASLLADGHQCALISSQSSNIIFPTIKDDLGIVCNSSHAVDRSQFDLADVEVIIYLAWSGTPGQNEAQGLKKTKADNIEPLTQLLDKLSKLKKPPLFVFFSTAGMLYSRDLSTEQDEDSPLDPTCVYGLTKKYSEDLVQKYSIEYRIPSRIIRPTNPFGPYQKARQQGLVASIFKALMTNSVFQIYGDGSAIRDYIFVDDLVAMVKRLIDSTCLKSSSHDIFDVFNVSSGCALSVTTVIEYCIQTYGRDLRIEYVPKRSFDRDIVIVNSDKARSLLNWAPAHTFLTGLEKTAVWFEKHGVETNES